MFTVPFGEECSDVRRGKCNLKSLGRKAITKTTVGQNVAVSVTRLDDDLPRIAIETPLREPYFPDKVKIQIHIQPDGRAIGSSEVATVAWVTTVSKVLDSRIFSRLVDDIRE